MILRMNNRADFLWIQIAEAHAADEWPIGSPEIVLQSITTKERCERALTVAGLFFDSLCVEPINQTLFSDIYAPWPTRCYVLQNNILAHIANVSSGEFEDGLAELEAKF